MFTQSYPIKEEVMDQELKNQIYQGFREHSLATLGVEGNQKEITLTIRDDQENLIGVIHGMAFWGGFHLKHLFVNAEFRHQGIGRILISQLIERVKEHGSRFIFVETMSFQAVGFYQKFGFYEEFVRNGFDQGASFHHLKKDL
ncbi:MAG: GNAT family N-acetyltransferase [Chlamydiales bacterium]